MDLTQLLAAKLDLDLDWTTITNEIVACKQHWLYMPNRIETLRDGLTDRCFRVADLDSYNRCDYYKGNLLGTSIVKRDLRGPSMFYLTEHVNSQSHDEPYRVSKQRMQSGWQWRTDLVEHIPYIKHIAEKIYKQVGLIRVFVMENTFLATHKDYISPGEQLRYYDPNYASSEYDRVLGLSLVPTTGNVPLKIWSRKQNQVVDVPGQAMLFNDSVFHGVPMTNGMRITIRIFGSVDFAQFEQSIDWEHAHWL